MLMHFSKLFSFLRDFPRFPTFPTFWIFTFLLPPPKQLWMDILCWCWYCVDVECRMWMVGWWSNVMLVFRNMERHLLFFCHYHVCIVPVSVEAVPLENFPLFTMGWRILSKQHNLQLSILFPSDSLEWTIIWNVVLITSSKSSSQVKSLSCAAAYHTLLIQLQFNLYFYSFSWFFPSTWIQNGSTSS